MSRHDPSSFSDQTFLDLDKKLSNAAVYRHAVVDLIFLKYISDAFDFRREELAASSCDPQSDYYLDRADYKTDAAYAAVVHDELEDRDYFAAMNRAIRSIDFNFGKRNADTFLAYQHPNFRWAVRPLDVLQTLNEHRPQIVHFSGHGSGQDEIVFQDNQRAAKLVSKEAITQTMAAASAEIRLVFSTTVIRGIRRRRWCSMCPPPSV